MLPGWSAAKAFAMSITRATSSVLPKTMIRELQQQLEELEKVKDKDWDELTEEDEVVLEGEAALRQDPARLMLAASQAFDSSDRPGDGNGNGKAAARKASQRGKARCTCRRARGA
ncbi:unnamed protein product [Symbiodinium sp. CCMP2592]|nr:unnamed protein product [Symbiodinium sp. CCMP2592]